MVSNTLEGHGVLQRAMAMVSNTLEGHGVLQRAMAMVSNTLEGHGVLQRAMAMVSNTLEGHGVLQRAMAMVSNTLEGHGVLQVGCSSPLTFNLCLDTFIRYISDQKFKQFGFITSSLPLSIGFNLVMMLLLITSPEN